VYAAIRCVLNLRKDASDDPANLSLPTDALGPKDGVAFSLGVGGWAVFDLGAATPIQDRPGADFRVWEKGDDDPYEVFVAKQWTGPWKWAGTATGSKEFDLSVAGLDEAQFVKIVDRSSGPNTGATPGADVDAIEAYPVCDAIAVSFSASPLSGEAPLKVTFAAVYDGAPGCVQTASWDFGDGGTSHEFRPEHVYAEAGVYTVKLTVSGPGGQDEQTRADYITVTGGGDDDTTTDDDAVDDDAADDDNSASGDDDDSGGCGC
jgi:hypothetical protein